jgi:SAM-dependent methyltransferase
MNIPFANPDMLPIESAEIDVLAELVSLQARSLIEMGCGAAQLARSLLQRWPLCRVSALEVDAIQHQKNRANPQPGLKFVAAGAEALPFPDAAFDGALMLKSLHHVPMASMDAALAEVARVLRPGAFFYVSEPIYGGALNELVRLYNDEGVVRPAAQAALDRALTSGMHWEALAERRFAQPVHFAGFDDFAQRMMYPSFADHQIDDDLLARVRAAYAPHQGADSASLVRPMHVRVLRRKG